MNSEAHIQEEVVLENPSGLHFNSFFNFKIVEKIFEVPNDLRLSLEFVCLGLFIGFASF